jgi:hypothetical protein
VELPVAFGALGSVVVELEELAESSAKACVKRRDPRITVATTRATNFILASCASYGLTHGTPSY